MFKCVKLKEGERKLVSQSRVINLATCLLSSGKVSIPFAGTDFENDGDNDLITTNQTIRLLENNGDGTFDEHVVFLVGGTSYAILPAEWMDERGDVSPGLT